ncbi:phage regulatory CII family protein [Chitinolyticbacter meiyuanensis]|uniref:phage regulatory CII family protein n=1 Tax=Chitinolyticbacter meiyuanensis TaxID=682798 RepID=UPI0011E58CEB|nr:phage regulatory CII family protein [Chitinolyticbacter meiyuanensis]
MSQYKHVVAAAQLLAKRYHNGITGLAADMGKSPIILMNKLNPNNESNQLSLEEAAEITDRTQSSSVADALAALCGRVTVALPVASMGFLELSREFCRLTQECGEVGREIANAQAPESEWGERISPAERRRIEQELRELLSVGAALLQRVSG